MRGAFHATGPFLCPDDAPAPLPHRGRAGCGSSRRLSGGPRPPRLLALRQRRARRRRHRTARASDASATSRSRSDRGGESRRSSADWTETTLIWLAHGGVARSTGIHVLTILAREDRLPPAAAVAAQVTPGSFGHVYPGRCLIAGNGVRPVRAGTRCCPGGQAADAVPDAEGAGVGAADRP